MAFEFAIKASELCRPSGSTILKKFLRGNQVKGDHENFLIDPKILGAIYRSAWKKTAWIVRSAATASARGTGPYRWEGGTVVNALTPDFRLKSVYADGTSSEPQVVTVAALPLESAMSRRVFFRVGITAVASVALLAGCGPSNSPVNPKEPESPSIPPAEPQLNRKPPVSNDVKPPRPRPKRRRPTTPQDFWMRGERTHSQAPQDQLPTVPLGPYSPPGNSGGVVIHHHTIEGSAACGSPIPPNAICTCNCVAY